jgi:bleomycin hydrolase
MNKWLTIPALLFILPLHAQLSFKADLPQQVQLTDSISCPPVSDQGQTPTCWAFGSNSLFETDIRRQGNRSVNFSEMFIARYAYIDKINRYLATGGKTYCEGGGQFHDVIRVIKQHGIVPEEIYNGTLGKAEHNHQQLEKSMKSLIAELLQQGGSSLSAKDIQRVNDTLDRYLGKTPVQFRYAQKEYTPLSFASEFFPGIDDYAEIVSFADRPLYKKFMLADKYNWANDSFYNVSLSDLQMIVDTAVHHGWSVGWEGDVTEKGFRYAAGYALFGDSAHDYDPERLTNYKNESTERDHMLQVTGCGYDENGKKWYYMKNSWGTHFSKFKGYLYMEENYFKLKTVILIVNKNALPRSIARLLDIR